MSAIEIISEIQKLPVSQRLLIVEKILQLIREGSDKRETDELSLASKELLIDYETDEELTAFTALDSEGIYEKE